MKLRRIYYTLLSIILIVLIILSYQYRIFAINLGHDSPTEGYNLSIMTFNVDAIDSIKFTMDFQDSLLEVVKNEKPDVLCFQELSFSNFLKIKPQLDSIYGPCEELIGGDQLWRSKIYSHYPLRNFSRHNCIGEIDTTDFTAEELKEIGQIQTQMGMMSAEFEVKPETWVKVYSCHLRSSAYSTARRSMNKDASWVDGISLYKRNYDVGKRIRDYEAENVRRFVDDARSDEMPVIVAGDLNDWCGSDCLNTLMGDDLKDAWWEGGNGFGWTYFGWHLRLRLDHILYSDELELVDVKVVDTDLSDHKPLMARFRLKD